MELIEMVLRLNGLVEPVGDSSIDGTRLANLKSLCELTGQLLDGIEAVAEATDDHLASVKEAKDVAAAFLRARGVTGAPAAATCWRCTQPATCKENGFCSIERQDLPLARGVQGAPAPSTREVMQLALDALEMAHDGTGDVHRADGEWLGYCTCQARAGTTRHRSRTRP